MLRVGVRGDRQLRIASLQIRQISIQALVFVAVGLDCIYYLVALLRGKLEEIRRVIRTKFFAVSEDCDGGYSASEEALGFVCRHRRVINILVASLVPQTPAEQYYADVLLGRIDFAVDTILPILAIARCDRLRGMVEMPCGEKKAILVMPGKHVCDKVMYRPAIVAGVLGTANKYGDTRQRHA